jgi:hypothetical protein
MVMLIAALAGVLSGLALIRRQFRRPTVRDLRAYNAECVRRAADRWRERVSS